MSTVNKNKTKKKNTSQVKINKEKTLRVLCFVVAVSILASLFLGFKLYAYGKDVKITYSEYNGTGISNSTQTVEVCKKYKLKTPTDSSGRDRVFLYWSTDKTEKGKVKQDGIWLLTTKDVVLYAVWGSGEWTDSY